MGVGRETGFRERWGQKEEERRKREGGERERERERESESEREKEREGRRVIISDGEFVSLTARPRRRHVPGWNARSASHLCCPESRDGHDDEPGVLEEHARQQPPEHAALQDADAEGELRGGGTRHGGGERQELGKHLLGHPPGTRGEGGREGEGEFHSL